MNFLFFECGPRWQTVFTFYCVSSRDKGSGLCTGTDLLNVYTAPDSRSGPSQGSPGKTSHVAMRKLYFRQLEDSLGTELPAVVKGYATQRDAKLAESMIRW